MNLTNRNLLSLLIAAAALIWRLAVPAAAGLVPYGGGMTCGLLAAALAILYLMLFRGPSDRRAAETGALSVYVTLAYVAAAMAGNAWLILHGLGGFGRLLLAVNGALAAGYIALMVYAERDARRLSRQLDRAEERLSLTAELSAKLGTLLGLTEDAGLRGQLLRLKEAVDYGSNITTAGTYENEKQMAEQLDALTELLAKDGDRTLIQERLREAERIWRTRSAAASVR